MADVKALTPASPDPQSAGPAFGGAGSRRASRFRDYLALVPFHAYVGLFLIFPTLIVAVGALTTAEGQATLSNIQAMFSDQVIIDAFARSIQLAAITAVAGAVFGGLLAWAVATGDPNGFLRPLVVAASGVLAQFGGVMLAFAFLATFAGNGLVTVFFRNVVHIDALSDSSWLYGLTGLVVVYTYFQIPLMLIVFLPALDGLRQEWYDASASLGGTAGRSGAMSPARSSPLASSARSSSCSRTPSPPTPRPPRSSARERRSSPSRSRTP